MIEIQEYIGNIDFLKLNETAFLCSQKCPAETVLKSYDWAKKQREIGNWIVCGNHSQIEKDVFEILLKGIQPLILILASGMITQIGTKLQKAKEGNKLLIISPFNQEIKRVTRETDLIRNQKMIEICDYIVVVHRTPNGQLDSLLKEIKFKLL